MEPTPDKIQGGLPTPINYIDLVALSPDHLEMGIDGQRIGGNGPKARHHDQIPVRCLYMNMYINETKLVELDEWDQTVNHGTSGDPCLNV